MPLEITRRDARREALGGLIDYAGLFPPTALGMDEAVAGFRAARATASAWMAHRFICPADRLVDLARALITTMAAGEEAWPIVVTATPDDLRTVKDFAAEMGRAARVEVVEMRLPDDADEPAIGGLLAAFDKVVFFEVPWSGPVEECLGMLAAAREASGRALGAKIRCGGLVAEAFPPVEAVGGFLVACSRLALPVKATAGLHHPFRHLDPATGFTHHGFVNLLAAAGFAHRGDEVDRVAEVVAETDPDAFDLDAAGLRWREERLDAAALAATRGDLFVGYGSCSFDEPVEDLTALGVLPVAP